MRKEDIDKKILMNNYVLLSQSVTEILGNKNLFGEEVGIMQDNFLSQLVEVMKLLLDQNIEEESFHRFMELHNWEPPRNSIAEFISSTVETDDSYLIMNYFYANMIRIYYENSLEDGQDEIDTILSRNQVDEDVLTYAIRSYNTIIDG